MAAVTPSFGSARRLVVKIGSALLVDRDTGLRADWLRSLAQDVARIRARGTQVILVSSGAIATAIPFLDLGVRPADLATQQAAAAVGQNVLMWRYQTSLDRYRILAGQVLLTAGDLENPAHRSNAQRAMERLLGLRVLPIVNENDTVATHEIRFGDNDRLAALVSELIAADLLVLLSDIDALYTRPPQLPGAERIRRVAWDDDLAGVELGDIGAAGVGTGGAGTKIAAARHASRAGIPVLLSSAGAVAEALAGHATGTWFDSAPRPA